MYKGLKEEKKHLSEENRTRWNSEWKTAKENFPENWLKGIKSFKMEK